MSKSVELEDSEVAVELVQYAYFKKVRRGITDACFFLFFFFLSHRDEMKQLHVISFCRFWRKRRNALERRGNLTLRMNRRKCLSLSAHRELEGRGMGF